MRTRTAALPGHSKFPELLGTWQKETFAIRNHKLWFQLHFHDFVTWPFLAKSLLLTVVARIFKDQYVRRRAGQRRYTPSTRWSLGLCPKLGSLSAHLSLPGLNDVPGTLQTVEIVFFAKLGSYLSPFRTSSYQNLSAHEESRWQEGR